MVRPYIPTPARLWPPVRTWVWLTYTILIAAAVPDYFIQYWFNQSLGFRTLFWTNFGMQSLLFVTYGMVIFAAITVPMRLYAVSPTLKNAALHVALWTGIFAGWRAAGHYMEFLLAAYGVPFGQEDPAFGRDIGFYVYWLPVLRMAAAWAGYALLVSIGAALVARYDEVRSQCVFERSDLTLSSKASLFVTRYLRAAVDAEAVVVALALFLLRYSLLFKDNEAAGVRTGAQYIDVSGVLSTVNYIHVTIVVELALCVLLSVWMSRIHDTYGWILEKTERSGTKGSGRDRGHRRLGIAAASLLAVDFAFFAAVVVRDHVFVRPNEPWVQQEFIQHHIDATIQGYQLDQVKTVEWNLPPEPHPASELLSSRTVQNAPFLPSWVSYLENPPDVQHLERLPLSNSLMVYGPMLQIFNQQQSLRPYYQFTNVDGVRYTVNGQKQMFVSAVRELPSLAFLGPKEWLRYWGSAALMFTHGYGLVMSPVNQVDQLGNPLYVSSEIPPKVTDPAFEYEPRIYFGEGARDDYVLTNVQGLKEFDHVTAQSREEFAMPGDLRAGIRVDSMLKRVMFALKTKDLTAFLFSRYIDYDQTRVHIRRTPMLRASSLAPFLFLDSNNHAFIADKKVLWMINGLTTSDMYPYSFHEILGDKAEERAVDEFPERKINYAEDSVKVVMDAYSGQVTFYKMTNDPIVATWSRVYPDLFRHASEMPAAVKGQLTYPLQWFHVQFDDIYKRYHQKDWIQFYNVEDLWDDADEVIGSVGRGLKGFGITDQSTFSFEGHPMLIDPADLPPGTGIGTPGELQYTMVWPFTPEGNRNLRAYVIVFQDPENYGKLVSLQIPQGQFVPGPEQIESYIDNDRPVHQQVTMWIRHASEVIRGHMVVLPVKGDLMYIETVWVNSTQNELPQLKLFAVRYRGRITSGLTLEEAIRKQSLVEDHVPASLIAKQRRRNGPAEEPSRTRSLIGGRRDQQTDKAD